MIKSGPLADFVFPARAGMSPPGQGKRRGLLRFPRASGDEPHYRIKANAVADVFPARAGMSLARMVNPVPASGFPRASGDEPS